jgi:hypothetical protein
MATALSACHNVASPPPHILAFTTVIVKLFQTTFCSSHELNINSNLDLCAMLSQGQAKCIGFSERAQQECWRRIGLLPPLKRTRQHATPQPQFPKNPAASSLGPDSSKDLADTSESPQSAAPSAGEHQFARPAPTSHDAHEAAHPLACSRINRTAETTSPARVPRRIRGATVRQCRGDQ